MTVSAESVWLQQRLAQAISDPGHFTPRGDNYEEPITSWSARAVEEVLGEWLEDVERRVQDSAAYARGKADGYADHARTFGDLIERGYQWKPLYETVQAIAAQDGTDGLGYEHSAVLAQDVLDDLHLPGRNESDS